MKIVDPLDTSDEEQVRERTEAWKLANQRETEEVEALMKTYGGRAFVWRILSACKIFTFGYCGDNNYLNNIEGRRWVGSGILEEVLTVAPKEYIMMRDEAASREGCISKGAVSRDAARKGKK